METPRWQKNIGIALIAVGLLAIVVAVSFVARTAGDEANQVSANTETAGQGVSKNPDSASSTGSARGPDDPHPLGVLPQPVMQARVEVRDAYAFATNPDNRELMQTLRCYCGCEDWDFKHDNLFMCYVEKLLPDDQVIYSGHAFGCKICLAEAWDASKWQAEGKNSQEIKEKIDVKFGSPRN